MGTRRTMPRTRSEIGRSRACCAVLLALGSACEAGPVGSDAGPVEIQIGCGRTEFTALGEGDPVGLYLAPAGSVWLFGAVRCRGLNPGDYEAGNEVEGQPRFTWSTDIPGLPAGAGLQTMGLRPVQSNPGLYEGVDMFVNVGSSDDFDRNADPLPIRVELTVEDADGRRGTATWNGVTAYDPPVDSGMCP